jgi:hypothetical protein
MLHTPIGPGRQSRLMSSATQSKIQRYVVMTCLRPGLAASWTWDYRWVRITRPITTVLHRKRSVRVGNETSEDTTRL